MPDFLPIPDSRLPIPDSRFPIPDSRFPDNCREVYCSITTAFNPSNRKAT
ncbi:MAG: hypothetical protein F6J98_33385 [Moorea sp. SIO4G2]|nr:MULTISPECIES: hypothetical protein [unclassified Moorena]NEO13724.1 hypothetical protein [Moorena sp. SIO3E8]NEO65027.1 hypothetical protein [Moorena sp. SIO4G2]NEP98389.1 hypothetical protein [Moorena sp. SIO3F7]